MHHHLSGFLSQTSETFIHFCLLHIKKNPLNSVGSAQYLVFFSVYQEEFIYFFNIFIGVYLLYNGVLVSTL